MEPQPGPSNVNKRRRRKLLVSVRDGVRSFFTTSNTLNAHGFRTTTQIAVMAMVLVEITVYVLLQQSVRLGEMPSYIPDVLIMSITTVEFFLGPFIGWLGFNRRRNIMVIWIIIALVCTLPLFATPSPVTKAETALCTIQNHVLPSGITVRVAIRLSILVLAGLGCALSRVAVMAHALAFMDEDQPSFNTHMNLAVYLLSRLLSIHVGKDLISSMVETMTWLQSILIVLKLILALVMLFKFPEMPAAVDRGYDSDRSLFRSMGRVLGSKMALLQILAMGLMGAAVWGFGFQEDDVAKVKFHSVAAEERMWGMVAPVRAVPIVVAVVLAGYMYTAPVMPVFKKKAALSSAARVTIVGLQFLVMMVIFVSCSKVSLAGMGERTYNQPACGLQCGCDRPWTSFSPVCDSQGMTTYFSPCHAGCSTAETASNVGFYSNCTCAAGGRVTIGACEDGGCSAAYALHTLLFSGVVACAILAITWQGTVLLESVDRRDKSVAVALASGTVSLFAFVGGHGLYMWFSDHTCASFQGNRCLLHSSKFVPLVGYTTIGLVSGSLVITILGAFIVYRQKNDKQQIQEIDLSRD